jgi:hypothetical protein
MLLKRLKQAQLQEMIDVALDALEPLSVFGAQLLWIAQPTLSLFIDQERITGWAELLEDPRHFAQWRETLDQTDDR